jgi:hypothetical protein
VVHQADLLGPLGRDAVAGEGVLLGQQQAGVQRPGDRPTVGGHQAHDHVGIGEVRPLAHEHHVRERHQAAAQAHGRPVDGGHHGHPALQHLQHQPLPGGQGLRRSSVSVVCWRRYSKSPPAENARPLPVSTTARASWSALIWGQRSAMPSCRSVVHRVEVVGPVQADDAHRAVGVDGDLFGDVVHGALRPTRTRERLARLAICHRVRHDRVEAELPHLLGGDGVAADAAAPGGGGGGLQDHGRLPAWLAGPEQVRPQRHPR